MRSAALFLLAWAKLATSFAAVTLPEFDFTQSSVSAQWQAAHHIAAMRHTPEGLEITISGANPYLHGPARDYPAGVPLRLLIRVKSEQGGFGQVFYSRDQMREENSVRFQVNPGQWTDAWVMMPPLGPGYRLRIDPPGTGGKAVIASLRFEPAPALTLPEWPKPVPVDFAGAVRLLHGDVELQVAERGFAVTVDGQRVAASHTHPLIGYLVGDKLRWLDPIASTRENTRLEQTSRGVSTFSKSVDDDGATWQIRQSFAVGAVPGAIDVEIVVEADRDRDVAFLPLLLLVASEGSTRVGQGVFAGLEYLDNEPSSSEADLVGPESRRQVPANHKITFPLMAVQKDGRYVGLIWDHARQFSALFDSPDRVMGTGGHVMGVLFPGSNAFDRREGSLLPTHPHTLRAGQKLILRAHIIGGTGASVVPAIQQYVKLRGLPPVPKSGYSFNEYVALAARGWLDSRIREANLFRHAVWNGFRPQGAADAAVFMNWLSGQTTDAALRQRLAEAERGALSMVPPENWNNSAVAHVRYPVQTLVFGHVAENAERDRARARDLLKRFSADGSIPYHRKPGGPDYGRTHVAPDANGLTAQVVESLLEAAAFSGDRTLMGEALERLRALNKFRNTVPRGAQTWEMPLHTPDILASAHLVRAYTLGYELTGNSEFLDQAIYWAWTGVPFVYLIDPVGMNDQPYGTIAVLGATNWTSPVWFGRPVQWCGLVYADALYRLIRHDAGGPWKQLADGITLVGLAYTWPNSDKDRQGLLADYWEMHSKTRSGPAINPGTVQVNAVRLFEKPALYDFRAFQLNVQSSTLNRLLTIHAPGEIRLLETSAERLRFTVNGWPSKPYYVLLNGLTHMPQVMIDGQLAPIAEPHLFQEREARLILSLSGQATIELILAE